MGGFITNVGDRSDYGQRYLINDAAPFVEREIDKRCDVRVSDLDNMTPQQLRALVDRSKALENHAEMVVDRAKDEMQKIFTNHLKISDAKLEVIKAGAKFISKNNKQVSDAMLIDTKTDTDGETLFDATATKISNIKQIGETQRATNREILAATLRSQITGVQNQVGSHERVIQQQENKIKFERYINGETDEVPEMPTSTSDNVWSNAMSAFTRFFR